MNTVPARTCAGRQTGKSSPTLPSQKSCSLCRGPPLAVIVPLAEEAMQSTTALEDMTLGTGDSRIPCRNAPKHMSAWASPPATGLWPPRLQWNSNLPWGGGPQRGAEQCPGLPASAGRSATGCAPPGQRGGSRDLTFLRPLVTLLLPFPSSSCPVLRPLWCGIAPGRERTQLGWWPGPNEIFICLGAQ